MRPIGLGVLALALLGTTAQAAVVYSVDLSRTVTSGPGGTLTITGTMVVDDVNTDNLVESTEILGYDLLFSTVNFPSDTHLLTTLNSGLTGTGTVLGISGLNLVVLGTPDVIVDSTNDLVINTTNPDPNSALFSLSIGRLDIGGGDFTHTFNQQFGLYGPSPNFDAIGEYLSNQSLTNTPISGYVLGVEIPEPGALSLALGGLIALAVLARRRRT